MTNRSTYESTCKAAQVTCQAAISSASSVAQETLNANASTGFGSSLARGVSASQDAAIRVANNTLQVAILNAQAAKLASEQVALDLLRSQGDVLPR